MCGGFTCSKNSLLALNILYVVVSFILIGVAAAAKFASIVSSLTLVSGIITCGVLLLLISIVGLVGASKHHQVMLFFYMIVLFIIFIIQFSVACACLAINTNQQKILADDGWAISTQDMKSDAQSLFGCCGYKNQTEDHPSCMQVISKTTRKTCCPDAHNNDTLCCRGGACDCSTCDVAVQDAMQRGFNLVGGVGLFFSFTEFIGVWLTVRYRNQRDPRANPSAFL
ncbi:tetraspanin-13-like isoform X2 [Macrobrachium nipponense]|uniref:tetraspanin-13-like isoform X2 n=1 Tax=Macrobrachium nipponense TaxID=159736 RepID=UPI0030C7D3AE